MSDKPNLASQFMKGLRSLIQPAPAPVAPPSRLPAKKPLDGTEFKRFTQPLASRPAATTPIELTSEQQAEESKRRMGFIIAYMQDPKSAPEFSDPRFVYKIITDERTYQTQQVEQLQVALQSLVRTWDGNPDPEFEARKEGLEVEIQACRNKLSQLFLLLKHITGVKGKTGGTDFLTFNPDGLK